MDRVRSWIVAGVKRALRAALVTSTLTMAFLAHLGVLGLIGWVVLTQGWWMGALPGEDIASLEVLHPVLRPKVDAVVAELEEQGWEVRVSSGWRSAERQDAIYAIGQLAERMGQAPWSRVRGGRSCHNQVLEDGSPGSAAVDLAPAGVTDLDRRAAFYRALGAAAKDQGLRWGGDFGRTNLVWARYDIGWDPAHIEDRALCLRLRSVLET